MTKQREISLPTSIPIICKFNASEITNRTNSNLPPNNWPFLGTKRIWLSKEKLVQEAFQTPCFFCGVASWVWPLFRINLNGIPAMTIAEKTPYLRSKNRFVDGEMTMMDLSRRWLKSKSAQRCHRIAEVDGERQRWREVGARQKHTAANWWDANFFHKDRKDNEQFKPKWIIWIFWNFGRDWAAEVVVDMEDIRPIFPS